MKYRKKPVVIEAFQMTKERRFDNSDWPEWAHRAWQMEPSEGAIWISSDDPEKERLCCGTLEGVHNIDWNDWIIQGIKGEIYPCKPDIFAETYDRVIARGADPEKQGSSLGYIIPLEENIIMDKIKLSMKISEIDPEMIELFTITKSGRKVLWAVSHYDLMYDSDDCFDRLKSGETLTFKLAEV